MVSILRRTINSFFASARWATFFSALLLISISVISHETKAQVAATTSSTIADLKGEPSAYGQCLVRGSTAHRRIEFWQWGPSGQNSTPLYRIRVSTLNGANGRTPARDYVFDQMKCAPSSNPSSNTFVCQGLGFDGRWGRFVLDLNAKLSAFWVTQDPSYDQTKETLMAMATGFECKLNSLAFAAGRSLAPSSSAVSSSTSPETSTSVTTPLSPSQAPSTTPSPASAMTPNLPATIAPSPTPANPTQTPYQPSEYGLVPSKDNSLPSVEKNKQKKSGLDYIIHPIKDTPNNKQERETVKIGPVQRFLKGVAELWVK